MRLWPVLRPPAGRIGGQATSKQIERRHAHLVEARVELLPGPRVFDLVVAAVLVPLGIWLALTRPSRAGEPDRPARLIPAPVLVILAAAVGCVGGIYGIGGGSILAPSCSGRAASHRRSLPRPWRPRS